MKRPNFWRRKAREQGRSRWPWGRLGLLGALLGLVLLLDPKLVPPMGPTATRPEQLTAHFTRCRGPCSQLC